MAHYAFIKDNQVIEVITGINEDDLDNLPENFNSWEEFYLSQRPNADLCKRTSYNTHHNSHNDNKTAFRGNFASIGFYYDSDNDVFIPQKPYKGWVLDETIWDYKAPVDMPDDANEYVWNQNSESWELINLS
jgi:hypothetical protein